MSLLRYSGQQTADWDCCVCSSACTGDYGLSAWTTPDSKLICEICITERFDQALHGSNKDWPVRWGNEELDPHDFTVFLLPNFVSMYLAKDAKIKEGRRQYQPDRLEKMTLGEDYQVCPRYKIHRACLAGWSGCVVSEGVSDLTTLLECRLAGEKITARRNDCEHHAL
jgi:hypothetical protein